MQEQIPSNGEIPSKKLDLSNKKSLYNIYVRRKPNGKKRIIHAPCAELKLVQKKIAGIICQMFNPPDCVFGFVAGRTCADAAKLHTGKDWIIAIDIKDFFPSITDKLLIKCGFDPQLADVLTLDGKLVQGSPASPVVSNYIFRYYDVFLDVYFKLRNVTYTRYADDITLSGMGKPKWEYVHHVSDQINQLGLQINKKKTSFMFKNQEQKVLGITVNDLVSINHKVRKDLREKLRRNLATERDMGMISYIKSVNEQQYLKLKNL